MPDVSSPFGRRPGRSGFGRRLAQHAAAGVSAGLAAAVATIALDRSAGLYLPLPASNSQILLGTLVGAVVTIAVFALWMRAVVVGLVSSQVSSRFVAGYLDDRFQVRMIAWMMGALVYLVLVTAALPAHPEGAEAIPAIGAIGSLLVVLAALGTVLLAMRNAIHSLSMPNVVRSMADHAFAVIGRGRWPDDPGPPDGPGPTRGVVDSPLTGWVQDVHYESIMDSLPPGVVVTVAAGVGRFVALGEPLAYTSEQVDAAVTERIAASFTIGRTRAWGADVGYALQQLVDVAEHAMAPSSIDSSTAYESLMHIRAVLRHLLHDGTPTGNLAGDDGRWIVSPGQLRPADHLRACLQRLVTSNAVDSTAAADLLAVLNALEHTTDEVGDRASNEVVSEQRSRFEELIGHHVDRHGRDPTAGRR